jgi:hypothetical protein
MAMNPSTTTARSPIKKSSILVGIREFWLFLGAMATLHFFRSSLPDYDRSKPT